MRCAITDVKNPSWRGWRLDQRRAEWVANAIHSGLFDATFQDGGNHIAPHAPARLAEIVRVDAGDRTAAGLEEFFSRLPPCKRARG